MGSLVKDTCLIAEADAPADEEVPVGIMVEVVVYDLWKAQHHITKEGRVLHHMGESWQEGLSESSGRLLFSSRPPGRQQTPSSNGGIY